MFSRKIGIDLGTCNSLVFAPGKEIILCRTHVEQINNLHEEVDYSPYEGFDLRGWPSAVFLRGRLISENQSILERRPFGKFLSRLVEDHKEVIRDSLNG